MTEPGASPEDPWVKVEYAYSDNSLDPGECLLHCLRVRNDSWFGSVDSYGLASHT